MSLEIKSICNPEIFEELYKSNSKVLRNYIYYKCGNMDLAEDLVQDSFMKIWKSCAKIIPKTVKSLLFKMTNNALLNTYSHKKVVIEHHKLHPKNIETNITPEFLLEEKEFLEKLRKSISNLPEKEREVFLLNRIDKKKYREIAELLEISIKTVEKRMSSALKMLRINIEGI